MAAPGCMEGMPSAMDVDAELAKLVSILESTPDPTMAMWVVWNICRVALKCERNPPIDKVIQAGCVPRIVQLLECFDAPRTQLAAAWVLTVITGGTSAQCGCVLQSGACPKLVALMDSPHSDLGKQAFHALANIARSSAHGRDLVISSGALDKVTNMIILAAMEPSSPILSYAVRLLCSCFMHMPPPPLQKVAAALVTAARLLRHHDEDVVFYAACALFHAGRVHNGKELMLQQGSLPDLIKLMCRNQRAAHPALLAVGNIVAGSAEHTQAVINAGALTVIKTLLSHSDSEIRRECCSVLGKIALGTREQIHAVVDSRCMERVIICVSAPELVVRTEAARAIESFTATCTPEQVGYLCACNCMVHLCNVFPIPAGNPVTAVAATDPWLVVAALEAVKNIIRAGEHIAARHAISNPYKEHFLALSGAERIEQLQHHPCDVVHNKAAAILMELFGATYGQASHEEEGEPLPPTEVATAVSWPEQEDAVSVP